MTTDPSWLNPCEPTDPELLDALKAETERRTDEFMRLRNAAPDLMEALKMMMEGGMEGPTPQAIETALAAIAKAEGRGA